MSPHTYEVSEDELQVCCDLDESHTAADTLPGSCKAIPCHILKEPALYTDDLEQKRCKNTERPKPGWLRLVPA